MDQLPQAELAERAGVDEAFVERLVEEKILERPSPSWTSRATAGPASRPRRSRNWGRRRACPSSCCSGWKRRWEHLVPTRDDPVRDDLQEATPLFQVALGGGFSDSVVLRLTSVAADGMRRVAEAEWHVWRTYLETPMLKSGMTGTETADATSVIGAALSPLQEQALLAIYRRAQERVWTENWVEHLEDALEEMGLYRRPDRPPAMVFLDISGYPGGGPGRRLLRPDGQPRLAIGRPGSRRPDARDRRGRPGRGPARHPFPRDRAGRAQRRHPPNTGPRGPRLALRRRTHRHPPFSNPLTTIPLLCSVPSLSMEELSAEELATRSGTTLEEVERFARLKILSATNPPFRTGDVTRVRLLQALEQSGIMPDDVGRAIESGEFSFAFVDALFPATGSAGFSDLDFEEVCRQFGFSMAFVQDVYAGLGLPQPSPSDRIRQDDLAMAPILQAFMGLPMAGSEGAITYATRFWGENLHRLTQAQTRFFETYVMGPLLRSGLTEHQMLEMALPQGALAQQLDEQVLLWLHHRHVEQNLIEQVLEHVEAAMERTGAIRRRPRQVPAIGFVDLSGFTALTETQGDEVAAELTFHFSDLVRSATGRHGGRPVKFLGDGVMCHFPDPQASIVAALEMVEEAPSAGLPPAHIGLHAGPVVARDSDYFGRTVNLASRVAAHAGPNQVLVTDDVRAMSTPEGVRFESIGPVSLKGIAAPVPLHQVHRLR